MKEEDPSELYLELSRFWVQRVLVPVMVLVGVGGNLVTIMVLTRRRMRCSTNVYLSALAVADLIYLFFVFVLSFQHFPDIHDKKYELFWRFYGISVWLCDAASSTSVWLTVSFTLERYIAVCHPIRGKVICTERRAKRVIAIIGILCFLATASTSFEHELDFKEYCIEKQPCTAAAKLSSTNAPQGSTPPHITTATMQVQTVLEEDESFTPLGVSSTDNVSMLNQVQFLSPVHRMHQEIASSYSGNGNKTGGGTKVLSKHSQGYGANKTAGEYGGVENLVQGVPDTGQLNGSAFGELEAGNGTLDDAANITCCVKKYEIFTEQSNLGKNEHYVMFMHWFSSVMFTFLPLVLIATFNCFLVHAVRKSRKERDHMTNSQESSTQTQEQKITIILICVVALFLVCQTPTAIMLIYTTFYRPTNVLRILGNIFNLFVTINAACNFILYCALSKKYRRTCKELFFKRKLNRNDTSYSVTRQSTRRHGSTRNGFKRTPASYSYTPRNLETQSLNSIPRSKSLMTRPPGKSKHQDLCV